MNKMDSLVCHIKITNEVLQNNARLVIYGYENRKSDSALKGQRTTSPGHRPGKIGGVANAL